MVRRSAWGVLACLFGSVVVAADPAGFTLPTLNIPTPTFGGMQFWSDLRVYQDWRIQRHVVSGHCRLLDGDNVRRSWGSLDECEQAWAKIQAKDGVKKPVGRVVVTLHGLGSTRRSMEPIGEYLRSKGDFAVINVSYASTRGDFADHAATLAEVVTHLEGVEELYFVCHSMGNLVFRQWVDDCQHRVDGQKSLTRLKRVVMVAPPNHGAQLAERFKEMTILEPVVGAAATRLAKQGREFTSKLPRPPCEFGIIAGGAGDQDGKNPILEGDDDLVVRVEETRLAGASDFIMLESKHRALLYDGSVHEHILRFLKHGYFVDAKLRQPIAESEKR